MEGSNGNVPPQTLTQVSYGSPRKGQKMKGLLAKALQKSSGIGEGFVGTAVEKLLEVH